MASPAGVAVCLLCSHSRPLLFGRSKFSGRQSRPPPARWRWRPKANVDAEPQQELGRKAPGWFDGVTVELMSVAVPAALALAADPITALVDTAFVGHIGSSELAAVGVSASVFNLVSKLFNVPLINVTTSLVAEQLALDRNPEEGSFNPQVKSGGAHVNKRILPAVSTSLLLAAAIGLLEMFALIFGSGLLMNIMGIPVDSPIRAPAEEFLTLRAFGAPAIIVALATQGTFRGFTDTKTPLYAIGAGNLVNAILDPILIFVLNLGVSGAAIATVLSEYIISFILLWELNARVQLVSPTFGAEIIRYLQSGALLIGRTISVLLTMTLATSLAAREGPVPMAGHQICLQIWLTVSLLNDALAIAGQALLANEYSKENYEQARSIVYKSLQIGTGTGVALGVILFFGLEYISYIFTSDAEVLQIARSGVWFVAVSQPINAIAFVIDGLYYGVSDFGYAAYSMFLIGIVSSGFLLAAAPAFGLGGVWAGLVLFMSLRALAGIWRLGSRSGPWKEIWSGKNP